MERFEVIGRGEIEMKRLHLPLTIKCKCPKCNTIAEHDFEDNYLSYPTVNKEETIAVYCKQCEDWFQQKIILKIAIEVQ